MYLDSNDLKKIYILFLCCLHGALLGQQLGISAVGCDVSEQEVLEIKQRLGFQKSFFRKELGAISDEDVFVKVFADYADFSAYAGLCCKLEAITTAFFNPAKNEIVVFKNEEFIRSLSHEISHMLMKDTGLDDHFWLSEGLADVMSSYKPDPVEGFKEERMYFGKSLKLDEKSTKRLMRFLKIDQAGWNSLSTYDSYGVSWVMVNYLYKEDRMLLREIIHAVQNDRHVEEVVALKDRKALKGFFKAFRAYHLN